MVSVFSPASVKVRQAAAECIKNILAAPCGLQFWKEHKDSRDPMLAYLLLFRQAKKQVCLPGFVSWCSLAPVWPLTSCCFCSQVQAVSAEESSEARVKLESPGCWIPVVDGHKAWLKGLCTTLLDSGGVKSEALLLSRPLCQVSCVKHAHSSMLTL